MTSNPSWGLLLYLLHYSSVTNFVILAVFRCILKKLTFRLPQRIKRFHLE